MSKTDKTRPAWVRLEEIGAEAYSYSYRGRKVYDVPSNFAWSNSERGLGRGYVKWAKRNRSKKNRKRNVPHSSMRGYGYGFENYRW